MRKYLELFKDGFDATVAEKTKVENWPYVGYSPSEGVVFTVIPEENQSGYQMVDLGLPSGLKWADRNIGAATPQDFGLYFDWGNVDGHAVDENVEYGDTTDGYTFNSTTYSTTLGSKYTGSTLDDEHDAAKVNMGGDWRMPTKDEIDELMDNTNHYYIGEDGSIVAGPFNDTYYLIKGLDGSKLRSICFVKMGDEFNYNDRSNFIEFPFSGNFDGNPDLRAVGRTGRIWSRSYWEDGWAYSFDFDSSGRLATGGLLSYYGLPIRGVHA